MVPTTNEGLPNKTCEELEKIASGSAYWLVLIGEARSKADQYNRAFFFYHQALAKMPKMRGVHEAVAEIYRKAGHPDWGAIEEDKERENPSLDCGGPLRTSASGVEHSRSFAAVPKQHVNPKIKKEGEC